jgi:hypothetical protein
MVSVNLQTLHDTVAIMETPRTFTGSEKGLTSCVLYQPMAAKMDDIIGLEPFKRIVHEVFSGEASVVSNLFDVEPEKPIFLLYGVRIGRAWYVNMRTKLICACIML